MTDLNDGLGVTGFTEFIESLGATVLTGLDSETDGLHDVFGNIGLTEFADRSMGPDEGTVGLAGWIRMIDQSGLYLEMFAFIGCIVGRVVGSVHNLIILVRGKGRLVIDLESAG